MDEEILDDAAVEGVENPKVEELVESCRPKTRSNGSQFITFGFLFFFVKV